MTDEPKVFRVLELIPAEDRASKPTELIQIRGHEVLTLNARRSITLLWHNAHRQGIEPGKDYTIEIDALVPGRHKGYEMVTDAIIALMTTLIVIRNSDGSTTRVQFLGGNDMDAKDRKAGVLTYSFDKRLISLLENSAIWGKIPLPELMALQSKYAISLYENVAQWAGLKNKFTQVYTVDEFRALLGVEKDKYALFGSLNRRVLQPAANEVNALAPFSVSLLPVKTGKKVTSIRMSWWLKDFQEQKQAYAELQKSKVGRRSKASGKTNAVLPPSPSSSRLNKPKTPR